MGGNVPYLVCYNTRNIENKVVYLFVKKKKTQLIKISLNSAWLPVII